MKPQTTSAVIAGIALSTYGSMKMFCPWLMKDIPHLSKVRKIQKTGMAFVNKGQKLIDIFEEKVQQYPDKMFLIFNDRTYSYKQTNEEANKYAHAALELGLKLGDVVALMIHNEPAFLFTYLGFMKIGVQMALINFNLRLQSLIHCIKMSRAKILLVGHGQDVINATEAVANDLDGIAIWALGPKEKLPSHDISFTDVKVKMSADPPDATVRSKVIMETPAVLIYTSGTTGLPKAAIVTHLKAVFVGCGWISFGMSDEDIVYEPLPLYHSAGLLLGVGNVITKGATIILAEKFSASHFWEDCRRHRATIIHYIGEVCRYLISKPKHELDGKHNIRWAFGNGLRADIWKDFQTRFKIPEIVEFYGATESPVALINLDNKLGAIGRSSPFLRWKLDPIYFLKFDPVNQEPVRTKNGYCVPIGPGEVGLMVVQMTPHEASLYQGYTGKKDTEKKILHDVFENGDSYFNSGDLIRVDKEYYLYFSDRVGDTYRWKGENVSTTEVSNVLTTLDFIHDANVYGVEVPEHEGKAGMAAITLQDQSVKSLSPQMLVKLSRHCDETLTPYAKPRFIRIQEESVLTSTFKQQKVELVKQGFDVTKISDPLFYLNLATKKYEPLDQVIYYQITSGKVPL